MESTYWIAAGRSIDESIAIERLALGRSVAVPVLEILLDGRHGRIATTGAGNGQDPLLGHRRATFPLQLSKHAIFDLLER